MQRIRWLPVQRYGVQGRDGYLHIWICTCRNATKCMLYHLRHSPISVLVSALLFTLSYSFISLQYKTKNRTNFHPPPPNNSPLASLCDSTQNALQQILVRLHFQARRRFLRKIPHRQRLQNPNDHPRLLRYLQSPVPHDLASRLRFRRRSRKYVPQSYPSCVLESD